MDLSEYIELIQKIKNQRESIIYSETQLINKLCNPVSGLYRDILETKYRRYLRQNEGIERLIKKSEEYSKLDYPVLDCPMKMPGFTNYDPNFNTAETQTRREQIENFDPEKLKFIQVTVNRNEENEKLIDDLNKILENS